MKNQKGITLVALVITIIVMLILVAVSLTVAIQNGLIGNAQKAKTDWEEEDRKAKTIDQEFKYTDSEGHTYTGVDNIRDGKADQQQSDDQESDQQQSDGQESGD